MEFTERFWSKLGPLNRFINTVVGEDGETVMFHRLDTNRQAGRSYLNNFFYDGNKNHILTAYLNGNDAENFRGESDESLLAKICSDLDQIYPDAAPVS